ncbi:MAG TPA: hypothetical protein VHJ55_07460, partial [Casimicrobiaceae bacterium]|nr:hypothetical protein [Casimicrobiaceae bacterium]
PNASVVAKARSDFQPLIAAMKALGWFGSASPLIRALITQRPLHRSSDNSMACCKSYRGDNRRVGRSTRKDEVKSESLARHFPCGKKPFHRPFSAQ